MCFAVISVLAQPISYVSIQSQGVHLWLVFLSLCELCSGQEQRKPSFLNVTPDDVLDLHDDWVRETFQFQTFQSTRQTQYLHTHAHRWRQMIACVFMCLIWMIENMSVHVCRFEEHMRRWTNSEENWPQWKTRRKIPLLPDSCCALHHSHNPSVLFISPVCFLSSYIDLAVSPYLYLLYMFSLLILHAHSRACMHTYTHTYASEMRTSRGIGVGVSRWKEANLWLDDWVIERVKGQSSKAVILSTSLMQTRTNAEMQERQPDPILQS